MLHKNDGVAVWGRNCDPGKGLSYGTFLGTLLEDCNREGWDVVDVRHGATDEVVSVYSFSVRDWRHPY